MAESKDALKSELLVKGSSQGDADELSVLLQLAQLDISSLKPDKVAEISTDADLYNYKQMLAAENSGDTSLLSSQKFATPSQFEYYVYLRSLKFLLAQGSPDAVSGYLKQWTKFPGFPKRTNLEGSLEFESVLLQLAQYFLATGVQSVEGVKTAFESHIPLSRFTRLLQLRLVSVFVKLQGKDRKALKQMVDSLGQAYAKQAFPRATETNDEYDEYLTALLDMAVRDGTLDPEQLSAEVDAALPKTFQSAVVTRTWLTSCALDSKGSPLEVIAAFKVYLNYSLKVRELNEGVFPDIVDVLDCFEFTLNYLVLQRPGEDVVDAVLEWGPKMRLIVDEFISAYNLQLQGNLSIALASRLSAYYHTLGCAAKFLAVNQSTNIKALDDYLNKAYKFFTTSIEIAVHGGFKAGFNTYFQHALTSAKLNKIATASKSAKECVTIDSSSFKSLNLLLLLMTAKESSNPQTLSLAETANQLIGDYIANSAALTMAEKWELVEFKKTYVAIKEVHEGIYSALDHIPDVFSLFHSLFNSSGVPDEVEAYSPTPFPNGSSPQQQWSHRPSIIDPSAVQEAAKPTHQRKKSIISVVTDKKHSLESKRHTKSKQSVDVKSVYPNNTHKEPLQNIWLWASQFYERAEMFGEAEKCIKEAESCFKPNYKTHSRFGLLVYKSNPKLAFQEFEISLDEVESENAESIVGLAMLSLSESTDIFISQKDKASAQARVLSYLENLTRQYEFCQSSEVYFLLSQLYELYGDVEQFEKSLFRTIELEEVKPLRPWSVVESLPFA